MQWLLLWTLALVFLILGRRSKPVDEVYALAWFVAGLVSVLWGFTLAPVVAQLTLSGVALGWLYRPAWR